MKLTIQWDLISSKKDTAASSDGFQAFKWRRRHIENYLLNPSAIARAASITEAEALQFFAENHGLAIPTNSTATDVFFAVRDARGKELMSQGTLSVESLLDVNRYDVAKQMKKEELAIDVKTFLGVLTRFASS